MSYGLTVRRAGAFNRLAEPSWPDPLDVTFSKARGGRWNAPGSYGVLYLNATVRVARLQVAHRLAGLPYGVEDLDAAEQHDLVEVRVAALAAVDCVTDAGLGAVGLPSSYPADRAGAPVRWAACQLVGQRAHDAATAGLACRSAAAGATHADEELGVFDTHTAHVAVTARVAFTDWYWGSAA